MQSSLFEDGSTASTETASQVNSELLERARLRFPNRVFVLADGPENADIVIVGESPGPPDASTGKPFSGPAGDLLRKMLAAIDVDPAACYLTNTVKFISQGDEIDSDTIAFFKPYLLREIFAVSPHIVIALGSTPAKALLNSKDSITKLRGRWADLDGIRVMPTFNPAYLLRDPTKKREVWEDVKLVRAFIS